MYSKSRLAVNWFNYFIHASNGRGHGIHSPFVYDLVREVLIDQRLFNSFEKIEQVKKALLADNRTIPVNDLGARGKTSVCIEKKISSIARKSVSTQKFGRLLFRLAKYYQARNIIELGSSFGISTAYLASAESLSKVVTMEGSEAIAAIAHETFHRIGINNIQQVNGNFDLNLGKVIAENPPADLVFLDGNHCKKPVLDYFEQFTNKLSPSALIVIHDIHWSRDMEEAWSIIQGHPKVKLSIDIFSAGLIFFRDEFQVKQKFLIRF
jgi:predicted O-methyltransferase YrrM